MARYHPDGSLDTSFNGTGLVKANHGSSGSTDRIYSLALQADGKIVTTGLGAGGSVVARYNADGSLNGSVISPLSGQMDTLQWIDSSNYNALEVQPEKRMSHGFEIGNRFT